MALSNKSPIVFSITTFRSTSTAFRSSGGPPVIAVAFGTLASAVLAIVIVAIVGRTVGQVSPCGRVDTYLSGYDGTVGSTGSRQIFTIEWCFGTWSWRTVRFKTDVLGEFHVHVTVEFLRWFASMTEEMVAVGRRNWWHLVRTIALFVQYGSTFVVILRVHLGVVHRQGWIHMMWADPVLWEARNRWRHGVPSVRHWRRNVIFTHHLW